MRKGAEGQCSVAEVGAGPIFQCTQSCCRLFWLEDGIACMQELRDNAEWRRWEQADKWRWREGERGAWAERLWRGQHERRIARIQYVSGQTRQRLRQEFEAAQASPRHCLY